MGGFLALASIERKIPPPRKRKKKGFSKEGGFSFFLLKESADGDSDRYDPGNQFGSVDFQLL